MSGCTGTGFVGSLVGLVVGAGLYHLMFGNPNESRAMEAMRYHQKRAEQAEKDADELYLKVEKLEKKGKKT